MTALLYILLPGLICSSVVANIKINQIVLPKGFAPPQKTTTEHIDSTTTPPYCRGAYEYTAEGYQFMYYNVTVTYDEAEAACEADDARLVVILDKEKDIAVTRFQIDSGNRDFDVHIGLRQTGNFTYTWNTGDTFHMDPEIAMSLDGYEYFEEREDKDIESPRDTDQNCIEKEGEYEVFKWDDSPCDLENRFICECPH